MIDFYIKKDNKLFNISQFSSLEDLESEITDYSLTKEIPKKFIKNKKLTEEVFDFISFSKKFSYDNIELIYSIYKYFLENNIELKYNNYIIKTITEDIDDCIKEYIDDELYDACNESDELSYIVNYIDIEKYKQEVFLDRFYIVDFNESFVVIYK